MRRLAPLLAIAVLSWSSGARAQAPTEDAPPEDVPEQGPDEGRSEPAPPSRAAREVPAEATAAPPPEAAGGMQAPAIHIGGYLSPGYGFKVRPDAVDRDRYDYGFDGGAGLIIAASPVHFFSALLHITLSAHAFTSVLVDDIPIDNNGDGIIEGYTFSRQENVPGIGFEEATILFQPRPWFAAKGGILRIPFTSAQQSPSTATLFPFRPEPNEVFLSGADFGALVIGDLGDGRSVTSLGVFNGTSLGMLLRSERFDQTGPVFSFRTDVSPFGRSSASETEPTEKAFQLGFGFGMLYRPSVIYDKATGNEVTKADDVRLSGSIRMAYRHASFALEYLRRQQVDDLSNRPQVADGAYAQIGWYIHPTTHFAFEPIGRLGFTVLNELIEPQTVSWLDLGVALYPFAGNDAPDVLKFWVQYNGERRITEDETAHGALVSAQLQF